MFQKTVLREIRACFHPFPKCHIKILLGDFNVSFVVVTTGTIPVIKVNNCALITDHSFNYVCYA
jgi:hypothetical protein